MLRKARGDSGRARCRLDGLTERRGEARDVDGGLGLGRADQQRRTEFRIVTREIVTTENCPTCNGTGEVKAPVLIIDELEHALNYLHGEKNLSGLTVVVHPFIHAYLTKGLWSRQRQWWWRWKKSVKVKPEGASQYLDFSILDAEGKTVPL